MTMMTMMMTMRKWLCITLQYGERLTSVSRGPELSRERSLMNSPVPLTGSTTPVVVCSPAVDVSSGVDEQAGSSSTIRRKGSLVPTLPITTQTTRLISQQSRVGSDEVEGPQRADSHPNLHGYRSPDLPPPPTSATITTAVDSRIPPPLSNHQAENGTSRTAARVLPTAGHRPPATAAATLPRDLPPPPTSATTTPAADPRLPTTASNPPPDWPTNRTPATPGHRPAASNHGTPTRTGSARSVDGAGHGSPARPKPAPPKRSQTTKLSTPDPRQTKAFIMNLDRVISLKKNKGSGGLATLPVPLPPRPAYVDGPTYLDTDDLPPPPAELLEGLRSMRRQDMPLPPIPAPGRR